MVCLEEIAAIANILKTAPASTVQLLHKIVNDEPYSKSSRKELKKFAGFPQNYDIEARKDKILKDFTKTELITVCTILGLNCAGSAKELSEYTFKNLSDLASLKNNFTEQLTDDEDSAPFSLESTNDANKQPLTPPIYHLPSPQDVFVPLPQTQRNQSQRGPAKTFIQTLHNILTYSSLKAALIEEFEDLFCSYDVHKEMQKRKLRPTESLFEYFLAMREIASKAHFHLDDHSLIMYCITGIPDSNHNKLILYACKSISEFKEKLKIYEKIFMQNNSYCIDNENKSTKFKQYDFPTSNKNMCSDNKFHNKDEFNDANVNKSDVRIRCYNCGLFNHTSNECYHKNKGLKCFNCNQFGHKSSQCVFKKPDVKNEIVNEIVSEVVNEINSSSEMRKTVKINGYDFDALIDTGSTITLIRESAHQILGRPTLNPTKINLASFGKSEIKTFGSFKSTINIEDNKFMTDIYVISNSQTTIDVIVGTDVLKQTEFKISASGIELIPKKKDHFINLINVSKAHNQSELKDNALEVLQLKLKNAEDKCKNLEMHICNTSTLSLEKTALLNKLHKLEESNLEKVDKLVKLEEKYEILQETLKITEKRLVEKEIECASLTEKILIVNAVTESNDHPKTSKSTKEREINPSKRKAKKSKSSGRNANKTSDSDENQAIAKEKNDLLRQIDFLNSIILDTKLKEPNKSKAQFFKKRRQLHKYKKHESVRTQSGTQLKLRPKFCEPYLIKTVKPHDRNEVKNVGQHEGPHLTSTAVDFMKRWSTADA
ncbi:retrovirus-related Pol polyprotein from transposon gypsy [Trichonephila clavipes]|nr:retrovirus-related Pol polyprotein from transposon gypsy [Trichonephila clavipes]